MDELAKKLSFLSFGIIGVICLIGVLQKRSWLEMFTIGGKFLVSCSCCLTYISFFSSIAGSSCYPGRSSDCHYCYSSSRSFKNGEAESHSQEIAFG